jgi:predicted NAD/FAD-binding protein
MAVPPPLTRREILKVAGVVAGAGALGVGGPLAVAAGGRDRVAVIGAGAGGIAAAYFLAGDYDVDIFESRSRVGGHCDSRTLDYRGHEVTVDLGAQFFHPETHPLYVTLLEELGLYDPASPSSRQTRPSPGSLCVFPIEGGAPSFTSTRPLDSLPNALGFAEFTQLARDAVLEGLDWSVTVGEWVASLPLEQSFKAEVLFPWMTATIGCPRADAERTSARSILQTFALAFPENPVDGASTYNSRIGLQGNLQRMLDRVPSAHVHRNAPVRALARGRDGWTVRTPDGRQGPYRYVVMNAPPRVSRKLLRPVPGFRKATDLLQRYSYFDSRLLVHRDPAYVYPDRAHWTAYNAGVRGRQCEGSAWIGALHDPLPSGATVDVFKSWAQRRPADPKRIVFERHFQHPLITPRAISAARGLAPLQGRHGLYFSGAYTTGSDLQETALYSAMKVAEELAPKGRNLKSLKRRMRASGIAGISYDL